MKSITIRTISDIVRTDDGDYERDGEGNYGTARESVYTVDFIKHVQDSEGSWNGDETEWILASETDAIKVILGRYGCHSYSASHWQANGHYYQEPFQPGYDNTWTEVTAHLEGFSEEESRAIHKAMTEN